MKTAHTRILNTAKALLPLAMIAGLAAPAFADSDPGIAAAEPASVVTALKAAGHDAVLTHDDSGDPLVKANIGGWATQIVFYDCNEITHAACQSLQFNASFMPDKPFDAAAAAAFVRDNRFGAVTVAPDRSVNVTWDVITGRGIDPSVFALVVKSYRLALDTIGDEVFSPAHRPHLASAAR
jgi:hypothetical protein